MLLIGLTGGIGSGKSTVGRLLGERGAVVLDADDLARRAIEPGTPGMVKVLDRLGATVTGPDGGLDRDALAAIVFDDPEARRALEAIVHPEVARRFAEAVAVHRGTDAIVVYLLPLLVENGLESAFDLVVTVSAPEETRIARLMAGRGLTEGDVRRRLAVQATDLERERVAGVVIDNGGGLEDLERQVEVLWQLARARASHPAGSS